MEIAKVYLIDPLIYRPMSYVKIQDDSNMKICCCLEKQINFSNTLL